MRQRLFLLACLLAIVGAAAPALAYKAAYCDILAVEWRIDSAEMYGECIDDGWGTVICGAEKWWRDNQIGESYGACVRGAEPD